MNLKIAALFGLIGSCILTLYTLYNITMFIGRVGFYEIQTTWIIERFISLTGWIFITIFFVFFYIQQKSPTDE